MKKTLRTTLVFFWSIFAGTVLAAPPPTRLGAALLANDLAAVREYVEQGGDVNAGNCHALFIAYREKKFEIAAYLESVGARISPNKLLMHYLLVKQELEVVTDVVRLFQFDHKRLPTRAELESELLKRDMVRLNIDHWGNALIYEPLGQGFKLLSLGSDSMPGGAGFAMDVSASSTNDDFERAAKEADPIGACAAKPASS